MTDSTTQTAEAMRLAAVEHLERRIADLERELDTERRYYKVGGDQVVEVGKYSYRWSGNPPPAVGERVVLPENWLSKIKDGPGPLIGVVTKLGTTYRGDLSVILRRAVD